MNISYLKLLNNETIDNIANHGKRYEIGSKSKSCASSEFEMFDLNGMDKSDWLCMDFNSIGSEFILGEYLDETNYFKSLIPNQHKIC